jgi:hypothetical protein
MQERRNYYIDAIINTKEETASHERKERSLREIGVHLHLVDGGGD